MGVAVDQVFDAGFLHDPDYFFRSHVHDVFRLVGVVALALHAHALGDHAAFFQGLGEHPLLPLGVTGHGAKLLVGRVQGAQAVAVHQQGAGAIQIHHGAFLQQSAATGGSEIVTEHEIPVAMHEVELAAVVAEAAEGADRFLIERGVIVVADPGFEQVAQYI